MKTHSRLKDFMPAEIRKALGQNPTYHFYCRAHTATPANPLGIARPGKTARDRAKSSA